MSALSHGKQVERIFFALLDQPREGRGAALRQACAGDETLRRDVQRMLEADDSDTLLDRPAFVPGHAAPAGALPSGHVVGEYRITGLLGCGGMGDVYEAAQDRPRRSVALKLLRSGAASIDAVRRFRAESDVLARLSHPGIAQVYSVGVYGDGVLSAPYFAMEFVPEATDIVRYAVRAGLREEQRLRLFLEVCAAVLHGHQRGVIHRDLKPGNVLVGADGRPKVIDFGVAKAQDAGLPTTLASDIGRLVGTLAYMSPEQLRGDATAIDVRTDVYSLGLILYELLAGRRAFELDRLSLPEAVRMLQHAEPPALGTLRGELGTIVATAIEKDAARRYASVSDLAADIQRFLRSEPIAARPASAVYRARKFVQRNRAAGAALAIAIAAVLGGAGLAAWKAVEATRQRDAALAATRRSDRINAFLMRIISAADPRTSSAETTIREAFDRAAESIEPDLAADDRLAADLHYQIGSMYERMKRHAEAERHLRAALAARKRLGSPACEMGDVLRDLAWVVLHHDASEAERLFLEAESAFVADGGPDSHHALQSRNAIAMIRTGQKRYAEAIQTATGVLEALNRSGRSRSGTAMLAHRTLGAAFAGSGRAAEAEPHYRSAVELARAELGDVHLETATTLSSLAGFLDCAGRASEATPLRDEADRIRTKLLGAKASDTPK